MGGEPPAPTFDQVVGVPLYASQTHTSSLGMQPERAFQSQLCDVCEHGSSNCCKWAWCTPCMAAYLKADLDGRECSLWDCVCGGFPNNNLSLRRHVRQKYNLDLEIATTSCGCRKCSGTYWQDVWEPLVLSKVGGVLLGIPCMMAKVGDFSKVVNAVVNACYACATAREVSKRRSPGAAAWSPFAPTYQGVPHTVPLYACCDEPGLACRAFWCPCCVMGEATAMLQGRNYDCCDCVSGYPPYALRKSVQAKYGFHDPTGDCDDCCNALWCGCCMLVQDHRELTARNSSQAYLPQYTAL